MGLNGKYPKFKDFRYVLDRAKEDMGRHTVLTFTYKGIKRGRKYEHIHFTVKNNSNFPQVLTEFANNDIIDANPPPHFASEPASPERQKFEQTLKAAGFMQDPAKTIDTYGEELVRITLKLAKQAEARAAKTKNPIHNLGGLIMHMLREGTAQKALETNEDRRVLDAYTIKDAAQALRDALGDARSQCAQEAWNKLNDDTQNTIHDLMKLNLSPFTLKQLLQSNWQGLIYERERQKVMEAHGYLHYPPDLQDVRTFAVNHDLLSDYDDSQKTSILEHVH
jgi:hypothetical protein